MCFVNHEIRTEIFEVHEEKQAFFNTVFVRGQLRLFNRDIFEKIIKRFLEVLKVDEVCFKLKITIFILRRDDRFC